ncbi:MAG: dihydropteroate synthase [Myxococcaceae bacterium]|nr:dihydropteroate synthase [Myxococcaceae bacterium]
MPEENASTRVLRRLGFRRAGEGVDDEIGRTWCWELRLRTQLMGVVNVTPDSFSDGGQFFSAEAAIAQGRALVAAGAELIDVGGESTRPGAAEVSEADELARVLPVLRGLKGCGAELSIDTTKPAVAAAALEAGATLVNDVTGLRGSDALARLAAKAGARLCVMHMQGVPRTMQENPRYDDVVGEVLAALRGSIEKALAAGVPRANLLADPGIGFGKTFDHNLSLLKHLGRFRELEVSMLVGTSRKAFLGGLTGKPARERDVATAATVAVLAERGTADIVRVHAVAEARDAALVGDAVRLAR